MAFDKKGLELLKQAQAEGKSVEEIIISAELLLNIETLKKEIKTTSDELYYRSGKYINENIKELAKLDNMGRIKYLAIKVFEELKEETDKAVDEQVNTIIK